jgi:hypothetical protein
LTRIGVQINQNTQGAQIIAMAASHHRPGQHSCLSRRQPKSLKLAGIGKFLLFPRGNFLKPSFYDLSFADLERVVSENDFNGSVARILFNWYYKKKNHAMPGRYIQTFIGLF